MRAGKEFLKGEGKMDTHSMREQIYRRKIRLEAVNKEMKTSHGRQGNIRYDSK